MSSNTSSGVPQLDITNCDKEPIHRLGKIQSHGGLIAVTSDWNCMACSANLNRFASHLKHSDDFIGKSIEVIMLESAQKEIREKVVDLSHKDQQEKLFSKRLFKESEILFDICIHYSSEILVIEFEPCKSVDLRNLIPDMRSFIKKINSNQPLNVLLQNAADSVANMTGFDRVMVYQFAEDGSGEVVAERVNNNVDSFIGLHYPASDIPKQARALYLRNLTRLIADVSDSPVEILPANLKDKFDLSISYLRAVSPIHIEYLKNMGIVSSYSISIIVDGELWGLFACHNYEPKTLSMSARAQSELFAEMFSLELSACLRQSHIADFNEAKALHLKMMTSLDTSDTLFNNLKKHIGAIANQIESDSMILIVEDEFEVYGHPVLDEDRMILLNQLNRMSTEEIFSTDHLRPLFDRDITLSDRYAGFLAIPISRRPRDYIIFLRKEEPVNVSWAGNPEKPIEHGPNGSRLTPRKSFAAWKQLRRDYCKKWTEKEINQANQIKSVLLEIMIRNIDERDRIVESSQKQQDVLIHELNHRVRNILGLISSIVSQTSSDKNEVEDFRDILNGRIQTLAVAQSTLTKNNWDYLPLTDLIETSLSAYRQDKLDISVDKTDVTLSPKAFTTVALVIHELTTNAVKYGALSNPQSKLMISISNTAHNNLKIVWEEKGIYIAEWPRRRGFGSSIIERSIPFDLNGEVSVDFSKDSLCVEMLIPHSNIRMGKDDEKNEIPAKESVSLEVINHKVQATIEKTNALVLEDNFIIAMEIQNILSHLGCKNILLASSLAEAEALMTKTNFDFAVLDVNLGDHTSYRVAERLVDENKPVIFVTGYAELTRDHEHNQKLANIPILTKPIQPNELSSMVFEMLKERYFLTQIE